MPTEIEVTAGDIEAVEKELQLQLSDDERIGILKEAKSCDVQAGPGSGKTTLLTAKLAILARKWPFHDRGICVLSHTNVARREIENKLARSPGLSRLLHYPHFIGTIQTFVDQFLAIPFLRRERVEVTAIDNERFGARAWAKFCKDSPKGRAYLLTRCRNDMSRAQEIVGSLRLDGAQMRVTHMMDGVKGFAGPTSETGQALIAVKQALRAEGYFRYDDMYAFAETCLFKVGYVASALRCRFPWVFVDELQDTSRMQDSVIEQVFGAGDCVFQRFGDKNQAIFDFDSDDDDGQSLFGRRNTLFLNSTPRFGQAIATLASRFTSVERQDLVGNLKVPDSDHTVFVFHRAAVNRVVPLFGDLVLKSVPAEVLQKQQVCVVGNRVNAARHARDNFPTFLGEYVESYISPKASKPGAPDTLLGYVVEARKKWAETGVGTEPYHVAISGILALLRHASDGDAVSLPRTKTALHQALLHSGLFGAFQEILWQMLNPATTLEQNTWCDCTKILRELLALSKPPAELSTFLTWENCSGVLPVDGGRSLRQTGNTYHHRMGEVSLPIRFDSVHGVKGETHAATLVVETFARQHDLKGLLPVLTATQHGSQLTGLAKRHCKRIFVGMTRPSHLLCFAVSAEHVRGDQLAGMAANGWKVVQVR